MFIPHKDKIHQLWQILPYSLKIFRAKKRCTDFFKFFIRYSAELLIYSPRFFLFPFSRSSCTHALNTQGELVSWLSLVQHLGKNVLYSENINSPVHRLRGTNNIPTRTKPRLSENWKTERENPGSCTKEIEMCCECEGFPYTTRHHYAHVVGITITQYKMKM